MAVGVLVGFASVRGSGHDLSLDHAYAKGRGVPRARHPWVGNGGRSDGRPAYLMPMGRRQGWDPQAPGRLCARGSEVGDGLAGGRSTLHPWVGSGGRSGGRPVDFAPVGRKWGTVRQAPGRLRTHGPETGPVRRAAGLPRSRWPQAELGPTGARPTSHPWAGNGGWDPQAPGRSTLHPWAGNGGRSGRRPVDFAPVGRKWGSVRQAPGRLRTHGPEMGDGQAGGWPTSHPWAGNGIEAEGLCQWSRPQ